MIRFLLAALALAQPALAGPDRHQFPEGLAQAPCLAFAPLNGEATLLLPEGERTGALGVIVVGERIVEVGPVTSFAREGEAFVHKGTRCATVDISGHTLLPGLIEVNSQIGLVEVSAESSTSHADGGSRSVRASVRAAELYDPWSTLIPTNRTEGITSAGVVPTGGLVSGRASLADLAGTTQAEALVELSADPVVASLPSTGRLAAIGTLHELFVDTRAYMANPAAYERNAFRPVRFNRLDLQAMIPVLRGEAPLIVSADRAADIEALLRLRAEHRISLVIRGGAEAWKHAEALSEAGVPVIVDAYVYGPGTFDQMHARPDNAALLAQAGVQVILSTFSSHNARNLRQYAGNAVRGGMDREQALFAITRNPAQLFPAARGEARGELRTGAIANLAVFGGDPLEPLTSTVFVTIKGRPIPLDSRQWRLALKYAELPEVVE